MVEYEKLYSDVKMMLSEKRFKHTEGVIQRAIEYAKIYKVDIETVKLAAVAHDIAKEIPQEESYKMLNEYGVKLNEVEKNNFNLIHAKLGAAIAKNKYKLSDEIVSAIEYHTTGKEDMSMLEKIIYLADATEPNRNYMKTENCLTLDELVNLIKTDINEGLSYTLKWSLEFILKKNLLIHLDSVKAYNFYKKV
jgi:predicted HD superfamily hydrolase involved in NAD metabolism